MFDAQTIYRQTDLEGSTPLRMVVMLYDQAIRDLTRAIGALEANLVETRTLEINHALLVVGQLQGTLDFERGGEVARNLDQFYRLLQSRLVEAQAKASREILEEQMSLLLTVREAWVEVEKVENGRRIPPPAPQQDVADERNQSHGRWSA